MLRSTRAAALAAAAALGMAVLVAPSAQAATKTVTIWTDEERGPVMRKLLGNKSPVPGYTFVIKSYASLTALDAAWASATAANGPDLVISNSAYAFQGAEDGKLMPLNIPASVRAQFAPSALSTVSYGGRVYGIPLDVDTTAMYYNKTLVKKLPKTFAEIVDFYKANRTSKGLTGGFCAMDGTWGSQPMLTALGGGAWALTKAGSPDPSKVLFNSAAFKSNVKKYLLNADGSSNGFFKWDGCKQDFLDGKIPFANSGGWQLTDVKNALGKNYGIIPVPGLKAGTQGQPWVGYQGIYVTTFAASHGVSAGAQQFALKYMANSQTQIRLSTLGNRPPANLVAAKTIKNADLKAFAQAGGGGLPQVDTLLNANASGANWYDILGDAYTKIFVQGQNSDQVIDAAGAKIKQNFASVK